jgi:predicted dehydrogenase
MFRSGQMGKVRKVIVEYLQDFLMYPHEKEGMKQAVWRTDPAQAGVAGTLGDAGTHCENLLEYLKRSTRSARISRPSSRTGSWRKTPTCSCASPGAAKG